MVENRIRQLREQKGVNMKQAARDLKMPYTTYVNYEKGINEPNNEVLVKLAIYYNVSADYLIGNIPTDNVPPETEREQRIRQLLETLSDDELIELEQFVDYLLSKRGH